MFAEKYGEVVLLSHRLSLFPADAGLESSHYFLLIDGLPNITQRMKLHFCSRTFFTVAFHSLFTTVMKVLKKKILLPIMVFLACLHMLPLVLSPPPDPVRVVHKWQPAPCCFASATFSRCCSITVGVRHRFNAPALCQRACHTRLPAKGRVNRSKHTPVYQSIQRRCRAAIHCGTAKADKVPHPKGYCCVNFAEWLPLELCYILLLRI